MERTGSREIGSAQAFFFHFDLPRSGVCISTFIRRPLRPVYSSFNSCAPPVEPIHSFFTPSEFGASQRSIIIRGTKGTVFLVAPRFVMTTGENSRPVLLLAITVIHYGDNGKGTDSNGGLVLPLLLVIASPHS